MKAYIYFAFGISLIFVVMGILILTGVYSTGDFFRGNEFVRYLFGIILVLYGIFRAYTAYIKMKQKTRKFHYYDPDK